MKTGSLWWKPSTGEVAWSDENYRIMEYPIGVTPTLEMAIERCHPDDLALVQEQLTSAVRDGAGVDFEHRLLMPNGSVKHVRVVFQRVIRDCSDPEFVGTAIDITEWKRAEERLHQNEAYLAELQSELAHAARVTSLGTLTASIAHEVNQPLAGIVTNAGTCIRMLASEPPDVDGARDAARRIVRDGNRASEVIAGLRSLFSRSARDTRPVDLNEATREVIALSRNELQRSGAILRLDLADDLPLVSGDRVQLQQVVINLLRNACEAMNVTHDRPRRLTIASTRDGHTGVCLSVRDSGIGCDASLLEKIFNTFYTTKPAGMGIGLSVSRSIIESHGGQLWAVRNEGPGVTFSFSLPCEPEPLS